ncbi:MAG: ATP-binding protein [Deltaproteobacteria bacterium]|nr:ATP-binding protein [Deltaproteobacteria bacterium]MBW2138399.1 ATP-binding protein [Deltaproteobacteria bacterium]
MANPFIFRELSPTDPFCNREEEQQKLLSYVRAYANVVLFSPRRYGKTSLVRRLQAELSKQGFVTIYVDFFGVSSVFEVASRIARGTYRAIHQRESLLNKGKRFLRSFKTFRPVFRAAQDGFSITVEPVGSRGESIELLESVMQELGDFAVGEGFPVHVTFDEFQEITRLKESPAIEGRLRSCIQRQKTSYCFVGSRRGILLAMFNDRKRPFFQSAVMLPLGPLRDEDAVPFLIALFEQGGKQCDKMMSSRIVGLAQNHPYYIQRLAFEVFELSGAQISQDDIDTGLENVLLSERFGYEAILQGLPHPQIRLLKVLAEQPSPSIFSREFLSRSALPLATIQHAKKNLLQQDLIDKDENGLWKVVDPLFARWLQSL